MTENVAVEDKVADVIPAEIDEDRDAGIRMLGIAVSVWNLDHVQILAGDPRRLYRAIEFEVVL